MKLILLNSFNYIELPFDSLEEFFNLIWRMLASKDALIVYIGLLFALIVLIITTTIYNDVKLQTLLSDPDFQKMFQNDVPSIVPEKEMASKEAPSITEVGSEENRTTAEDAPLETGHRFFMLNEIDR
ncbi:MAG TPA: hypothetical protein VIK63_04820, partial [Haloplasmataceae bacterium]